VVWVVVMEVIAPGIVAADAWPPDPIRAISRAAAMTATLDRTDLR
jgi:hypothetical protein